MVVMQALSEPQPKKLLQDTAQAIPQLVELLEVPEELGLEIVRKRGTFDIQVEAEEVEDIIEVTEKYLDLDAVVFLHMYSNSHALLLSCNSIEPHLS